MHAYYKTLIYERFFYDKTFLKTKTHNLCAIKVKFSSFHEILNVFVQF